MPEDNPSRERRKYMESCSRYKDGYCYIGSRRYVCMGVCQRMKNYDKRQHIKFRKS